MTPDTVTAYDQLFHFGAVEGIGFYFSSGDYGDEERATGTKQVHFPADSAWVTGVGGTSRAVGQGDTYRWETGWGTWKAVLTDDSTRWRGLPGAFNGGAGGGPSSLVLAVARADFDKGHDAADGLVTSVRSLGKDTSQL